MGFSKTDQRKPNIEVDDLMMLFVFIKLIGLNITLFSLFLAGNTLYVCVA